MAGGYSLWEIFLFVALVVAALVVDLLAHRQDKAISVSNAAAWSVFWIALSLGFALYIGMMHGRDHGMLFLTGYFLEKSLSVDNLFVFIAIFASFSIQAHHQHRILYYGILGAVVMRLIFVGLGSSVIFLFGKGALFVFGIFVLWTAWKMWRQDKSAAPEMENYNDHWSVRMTSKILPVYPKLDGHNFFTRQNGVLCATPLFLCLVTVELADVMFAFDSVPAIFSIFAGLEQPLLPAEQTFLVYTSNIFAILGLRSLYFLLAAANRFLCHLETAIIAILVFVGVKMLAGVGGFLHLSAEVNLAIVLGLLLAGIVASYVFPKKDHCSLPPQE